MPLAAASPGIKFHNLTAQQGYKFVSACWKAAAGTMLAAASMPLPPPASKCQLWLICTHCLTVHVCHTGFHLPTPRDNAADLDKMVASLRDGTYTALVLDTPVLEYVTSQNAECDLFLVGNTFETFSVALAFPPAANASTVYDFSRGIVQLQVGGGTATVALWHRAAWHCKCVCCW